MKFDLLSDIHLNVSKDLKIPFKKYFPEKTESDYLLIAGDLCEDLVGNESVKDFLTKASKLYKKIVFVLGNHDYWHINEDALDETKTFETIPNKFIEFVKSFDSKNKIVVLNNSFVKLDDTWVFGSTLWSDIPPQHYLYIRSRIKDYRCIFKEDSNNVTYFDTVKANYVAFTSIRDFVSLHRNEKIVLLTHHAPSYRSGSKGYDKIMDYAYLNDYDNFIIENPNIVAWCHGHIHETRDYMIETTRILANPLGYVGDNETMFWGGYERSYNGKEIENWHLMSVEV